MQPTARPSARLLLALGLLVLGVAVLPACGGGDSSTSAGTGVATGAGTTSPPTRQQSGPAAADACRPQLGGFLASLNALRRKLEVGLGYGDYVAEVARVRRIYDRLPTDRLAIDCVIDAGGPAEKAFNGYIAAANVWGECLAEAGCGAASIEGRLQDEWHVASRFLSRAQRRN